MFCGVDSPATPLRLEATTRRFFIVLSYAWGYLLSGEKPDKGEC